MMLLFGAALLADVGATEAEKWIGPVMTSVVNLAATAFAYLTARDRLRYDSSHAIKDVTIKELQDDTAKQDAELQRLRRRVNRLALNLIASQHGKPLPFPTEMGFSGDEDNPTSGTGA